MLRGLRRWLGEGRDEDIPAFEDERHVLPDGLDDRIETVETAALAVYARHSLPTQAGSYLRRGPDASWEKLPDTLTPLEKWELLEEAPPEAGWRFVERSGLGRNHPVAEVQRASLLLAACNGLRARLEGKVPTTAQDVADALQLGAASAWLEAASDSSADSTIESDSPHTPLQFMPVSDAD